VLFYLRLKERAREKFGMRASAGRHPRGEGAGYCAAFVRKRKRDTCFNSKKLGPFDDSPASLFTLLGKGSEKLMRWKQGKGGRIYPAFRRKKFSEFVKYFYPKKGDGKVSFLEYLRKEFALFRGKRKRKGKSFQLKGGNHFSNGRGCLYFV